MRALKLSVEVFARDTEGERGEDHEDRHHDKTNNKLLKRRVRLIRTKGPDEDQSNTEHAEYDGGIDENFGRDLLHMPLVYTQQKQPPSRLTLQIGAGNGSRTRI